MPKPEDRKLTPKENYMRVMRGEMPEWVPIFTWGAPLPDGDMPPAGLVKPLVIDEPPMPFTHAEDEVVYDLWGQGWLQGTDASNGAMISDPYHLVLEDIDDWHDVVHAPDISDVDWEMMCKQTMAAFPYDRSQTATCLNLFNGAFLEMVALMGFTEALIALYEEPEESAALLKYINDFYIEVGKRCIPYLQPDVIMLGADDCNAKAPFMDEGLFRQCLLPTYRDLYEQLAEPYGTPIMMHECGAALDYIEIMHEEAGVVAWESAMPEPMNDLRPFKEKWGREIAIMGGYDVTRPDLTDPDCPDELITETTQEAVRTFAPEGGYIFDGMFVGNKQDPRCARKNIVMQTAAQEICNTFYDEKLVGVKA